MRDRREFWSEDLRYGLALGRSTLDDVFRMCREVGDLETGGILVGHYNRQHDCALVTRASAPPVDSSRGHAWFKRGLHGLKSWLHSLWSQGNYYLGEWHYHPGAAPTPSVRDRSQMFSIARSPSYQCPEPVGLIVGGIPDDWLVGAFVFTDDGMVELRRVPPVPSDHSPMATRNSD